ncbi:MAG: hypothetical protein JNN17_25390 [Verrucomicrobiaceae bacterium]|nr:hypothetical protein [Verrucomicrobiaceae bacterium]
MKTIYLLALASLMAVSSTLAVTIPVTSGSIVVDFDAAALASVNIGSDPNIGGLILEEFFRGDEDRNRTRTQIMTDHLVPNYTAIPGNSRKYEINGTTVTNLAGRTRKPSTFSYDPANVAGTATGEIGLTGVTRFIGDFTGVFVLGDFTFRRDPTRGWMFVNWFDFADVPAFETANVTVTATGGKLIITGDVTISQEFDLFFLPGDHGKDIGNFRLETPLDTSAPALPVIAPAGPSIASSGFTIGVIGKGNAIYQLQWSSNLTDWFTVGPKVNGTGSLIQWTDNGPPLTPSPPAGSGLRFYRLIED